jgi:hypothetical protein
MQPYFGPSRKTTSQKNQKQLLKKRKMKDDLKKNEMEDDLYFKTAILSLFNNKNLKNKWF